MTSALTEQTSPIDTEKHEEHLRLANVVKGSIPDGTLAGGNFQKIWKEHCQNDQLLMEYADAMHNLAVNHWSYLPQTRITWCRQTIHDFFLHDGLHRAREKDARRHQHQLAKQDVTPELCAGDAPSQNTEAAFCASNGDHASYGLETDSKHQSHDTVSLPFRGKIRLLDVGSCFNPFLQFDEFLAVGIDISPAKSSVYHCDFLHLETHEPLQVAPDTLDTYLSNLRGPIEKLPQCSFHVVVFSLLLEYFPSPYQRWLCCQKAHKLLMVGGLLLIVSPDSHQQHRNADMIKSWKKAIESMGFSRWRYMKLEHLHCLAFRKTHNTGDEVNSIVSDTYPEMMYIPQDSNSAELSSEQDFLQDIFSIDNEEFFRKTIHELPLEQSDEEESQ